MEFFNCQIQREDGLGFALFSPGHGAYLFLCALLAGALCLAFRRGDRRRRRRLRLAAAGAAVCLELLRALTLVLSGAYGLDRLPLHLCSLANYLLLVHALGGGELLGQFLAAFCLPGAAAALLLPDWNYYPLFNWMTLCCFLLHALTVGYTLMLMAGGELRPEPRRAPACLGLMLALAAPVYIFNKLAGTNYMFLNWPPERTPLAWFAFLGRPGYLLGYLPLIAAVWLPLYGLPWARARKKEKDLKKSAD